MIELRVLGMIELDSSERPDAAALLSRPSPTALLAYLASAPHAGFLRRDAVVTLFWPETSQAQARANLRKLVHSIRAQLGPDCIESRGDEELRVSPSVLWCDVAEFRDALRHDLLERAMELYRGPLMPGFHLDGGGEFSRWLDDTRRQLARDAGKGALRLAEQHLRAAQRTQASDLAQFIARIGSDLDDEYLFRKLLDLLLQLGDHATALKMYTEFSQRIEAEFGGKPSPQTRDLIASIRSR
ncbi:MAG TPA: BTAD domain-containing putative transcriptional regulator [Gemmatimonadaceae bacterium]